jgi:AGCS family alanine or glycine:cation symporter
MGLGVLLFKADQLPRAFQAIVQGAFQPSAVTGGVIASFFIACRTGAARGVFTNEAGMGTASIAHAAADVTSPVEQGLMGIIEVFFDTIVLCTLTALAILCSGVNIPYGTDPGIKLALYAFSYVYGDWCQLFITILISLFAFATILGWGLYGVRCLQYLFGDTVWRIYGLVQTMGIIMGSIIETSIVWTFSEIVNGLMAIPNLIALIILAPEFITIIRDYTAKKAYS